MGGSNSRCGRREPLIKSPVGVRAEWDHRRAVRPGRLAFEYLLVNGEDFGDRLTGHLLTECTVDDDAKWLVMARREPSGKRPLTLCKFAQHRQTLGDEVKKGRWDLVLSTGVSEPARPELQRCRSHR